MSRKILHQWKAEAFWCCSSFHQVFQGSQYCFESWEHLENKPFSSFANKSWIWFVTSMETPESFHFSKPFILPPLVHYHHHLHADSTSLVMLDCYSMISWGTQSSIFWAWSHLYFSCPDNRICPSHLKLDHS